MNSLPRWLCVLAVAAAVESDRLFAQELQFPIREPIREPIRDVVRDPIRIESDRSFPEAPERLRIREELPGVSKSFEYNHLPSLPTTPGPRMAQAHTISPGHGVPIAPAHPQAPFTNPQFPTTGQPGTPIYSGMLPFESRAYFGDSGMRLRFRPGDDHLLQLESAEGAFRLFAGGQLQIDATWLKAGETVQAPPPLGGIGPVRDAVNFRRARFNFGGTFYRNIDFLMEFDFINTVDVERTPPPAPVNTPVPTELWVTFREIPGVGNLRIGNQKNPISLEHLTSSRFLNFMERSLAFDAFVENQNNGFEPGVMLFNNAFDQRMYWAAGIFKNTRNIFGWNTGNGEYDLTGRATFLPVWEGDGEYMVHLGLGAGYRALDEGQDRMRTRLLVRNGPAVLHNVVADIVLNGSRRQTIIPEFAAVAGPWTFQAEYHMNWINQVRTPADAADVNRGTAHFKGGYIEALYFLTGEHQYYDRSRAAFGRVIPRAGFRGFGNTSAQCDECGGPSGWGALQVGLRCSWVDLNDGAITGGKAWDVTAGLNWFLNPYMKWQFNYTLLRRDAPATGPDGWIHSLGTRIAFDF